MSQVTQLIADVVRARADYEALLGNVPEAKAQIKPDPSAWSIVDITEHLYWAEHGGIAGMWKTLQAIRAGTVPRTFESVHKCMPVEKIIEQTWQPKEQVPAVAAPRMGGTLAFWQSALHSLKSVLEAFGRDLQDDELRLQAHPHPISGPMDFQQRLEFLKFHINRHGAQVTATLVRLDQP